MEALLTRENLRDPRYAVLTDFSSPSETLIVSFAGLGAGNNCPPFEFGGALRNFDVKKPWCGTLKTMPITEVCVA